MSFARIFSSRYGPILTGAAVGVAAPLLVYFGNPKNMGICVACFLRDTAGALGLHRAAPVQYVRPEIIGVVLGALVAALLFREFKARTGSAPLARFVLGFFAVLGALVFLGCPWRAYLRLGGGDLNALLGIAGLAAGVGIGILFLKRGFSLARNRPASPALGWLLPVLMLALLALLLLAPQFGKDKDGNPAGPIFLTADPKAPGGQHAFWALSLGVGALAGFLAQRSRFCTIGALRDVFLLRDPHLLFGVLALLGFAAATNAALGQFATGFAAQPIAHSNHLWNFAGMVLSGVAFTLAGGCPGRQLILSGEGDGDAGVFTLGMLAGVAFAHNFSLAAAPDKLSVLADDVQTLTVGGPSAFGQGAVLIGLAVCVAMGLTMREPKG